MARKDEVPQEQPAVEGDVIHPTDHPHTADHVPTEPTPTVGAAPVPPNTGAPAAAGPAAAEAAAAEYVHPKDRATELAEAGKLAMLHEDPEIAAQQVRIAELEQELAEAQRADRRRMVDADHQAMKDGLDQREAELRAQLARVRGEEPHEE
jgi:hypothetical protein